MLLTIIVWIYHNRTITYRLGNGLVLSLLLAILYQVQGNDTIATIGLGQGLSVITCGGINLLIPCERTTELSSELTSYILTRSLAILYQVHGYNAITATCQWEGLYFITCGGIDCTIPIVRATELSIELMIYISTWSFAILYQVHGHNAIATTCQWEGLYFITCFCINCTIPVI